MGFWHTGYIDHHEPTGLGSEFQVEVYFPCARCEETFSSIEALRHHRFEQHPLYRPVLIVRGRELGSHRAHFSRALEPTELEIGNCDAAFLNHKPIPSDELPSILSGMRSDTCNVRLANNGVVAEFVLEFRVASDHDIKGVEAAFLRLASGRRLNTRVVEDFIDSTAKFESAKRYSDGVCSYLFGVLRREESLDIPLPFERYVDKYNAAIVALADYDRPLAKTIAGIVAFHLNQFPFVRLNAGGTRVHAAASRLSGLLEGRTSAKLSWQTGWEPMITDLQTEQLITWAIQPVELLPESISEMEAVLMAQKVELDRPKLHILLGEAHFTNGNMAEARRHAAELRNITAFETWAEGLIQKCS